MCNIIEKDWKIITLLLICLLPNYYPRKVFLLEKFVESLLNISCIVQVICEGFICVDLILEFTEYVLYL